MLKLDIKPHTQQTPQHANHKEVTLPLTDLVLWIDGECPNNPGGDMFTNIRIKFQDKLIFEEIRHFCGPNGTNNQAEMHAYNRALTVLRTIQKAHKEYKVPCTIASDSELATRIMSGAITTNSSDLLPLRERFNSHTVLISPKPILLWIPQKQHKKLKK